VGVAAIPALTNAFASPDPYVRAAAVRWLGINQPCFQRVWADVLPLLKDSSVEVRCSAVQSIGHLEVHPEIVVPAMTNLLGETNENVVSATWWGLTHFRTNAVMAVPLLLPLCNHPSQSVRDYAKGAILAISPEAAEKAGIR
jgi:HEAT repeat protein